MSGRTCERWLPGSAEVYRTPKAVQFIGADDFFALAVKVYMAAARAMVPPNGERWADEGVTWANPEDFYRELIEGVAERLRRVALESGVLREVPWGDDDAAAGGAGRSPAVKGHGCPALAPAVGPAPTLRPEAADSVQRNRADITTPASPLFCGQQVQKLPGALPPATVTQQREEA